MGSRSESGANPRSYSHASFLEPAPGSLPQRWEPGSSEYGGGGDSRDGKGSRKKNKKEKRIKVDRNKNMVLQWVTVDSLGSSRTGAQRCPHPLSLPGEGWQLRDTPEKRIWRGCLSSDSALLFPLPALYSQAWRKAFMSKTEFEKSE